MTMTHRLPSSSSSSMLDSLLQPRRLRRLLFRRLSHQLLPLVRGRIRISIRLRFPQEVVRCLRTSTRRTARPQCTHTLRRRRMDP